MKTLERPLSIVTVRSASRGRWVVICLMALALLSNVAMNSIYGMLPLIAQDFHLSGVEVGVLGDAAALPYLVVTLPLAALGDRFSRPLIIGLGAIGWSLLTGISGLAGGFALLALLRLGDGTLSATYDTQAPPLLADSSSAARRSSVMSGQQALSALGAFVGVIFAGHLADAIGWHSVFWVVGALSLPCALLMCFQRDLPRGAHDAGGVLSTGVTKRALRRALGQMLHTRAIWLGTLGRAIQYVGVIGVGSYLPLYAIRQYHVSNADAANAFAFTTAGAILGATLGGWAANKLRERFFAGSNSVVAGVATLGCGGSGILAMLMPTFSGLFWLMIVTGVFLGATYGPLAAALSETVDPEQRSSAYGLQNILAHVPALVVILLIGAQLDNHAQAAMVSMGVVLGAAGLVFLVMAPFQRRDAERLAARRLHLAALQEGDAYGND